MDAEVSRRTAASYAYSNGGGGGNVGGGGGRVRGPDYTLAADASPIGFSFHRSGDQRQWSFAVDAIVKNVVAKSSARGAQDCGATLSSLAIAEGAQRLPKVLIYIVCPPTPRMPPMKGDTIPHLEAMARAGVRVIVVSFRKAGPNVQAMCDSPPAAGAELVEFFAPDRGYIDMRGDGDNVSNRRSAEAIASAVARVCPPPRRRFVATAAPAASRRNTWLGIPVPW
jgi:hypothetical protein